MAMFELTSDEMKSVTKLFFEGALDHLLLQLLHLDALLPRRHAVAGGQTGLAAAGANIFVDLNPCRIKIRVESFAGRKNI